MKKPSYECLDKGRSPAEMDEFHFLGLYTCNHYDMEDTGKVTYDIIHWVNSCANPISSTISSSHHW
ncbi:hypothetical protein [Cerasicoccus frondis]|uniref:hypothetical protein n=1 Tax=Cerasicoccus frondis TaxID=490090 RepID=UPI002852DA98|nr:hypothetical protein [Cerasicoccus frondis]